jgi:ribonuclease HI
MAQAQAFSLSHQQKNNSATSSGFYFPAFNNAAEYEACLHGMRIAIELAVKRLHVYGDSALVIN